MTITEVRHLPFVKHYAKRLRLVETINEMGFKRKWRYRRA
jgi:hypothetical protein